MELDFSNVVDVEHDTRISDLEAEVLIKRDALKQTEAKQARLTDAVENATSPVAVLMDRLTILQTEHDSLTDDLKRLENQLDRERSTTASFSEQKETLERLVANRDDPALRYLLRSEIRTKVKRIDLFPAGNQFGRRQYDQLAAARQQTTAEEREYLLGRADVQSDPEFLEWIRNAPPLAPWDDARMDNQPIKKEERFFSVTFANGAVRTVKPDFTDPKRFAELKVSEIRAAREVMEPLSSSVGKRARSKSKRISVSK